MVEYGVNDYYKSKLEQGLEYQDFISDELRKLGIFAGIYSSRKFQIEKGESSVGIEIKYDMKFRKTGNLYIEIAEKSDQKLTEYTPSGVMRNDNSWLYVIGDYNEAFIFSTAQLRDICSKNVMKFVQTPTSRGYLFPLSDRRTDYLCLKKLRFTFSSAGVDGKGR